MTIGDQFDKAYQKIVKNAQYDHLYGSNGRILSLQTKDFEKVGTAYTVYSALTGDVIGSGIVYGNHNLDTVLDVLCRKYLLGSKTTLLNLLEK